MACFRRDWARVECSQQSAGAGVLGEKRRAASGIYRSATLSIISSLRRKNRQISLLIEIGMLILVGILHNRVPKLRGRLAFPWSLPRSECRR